MPTKLRKWNVPQALLCRNFLGGDLELFYHTYAQDPHQILSFTSFDACTKFHKFSNIPSTSKMLKVIRGCYRANVPCPSPIVISMEIFTSSNIVAKFHELLQILTSSNMFVKWKLMHKIKNFCLAKKKKSICSHKWEQWSHQISWRLKCLYPNHNVCLGAL